MANFELNNKIALVAGGTRGAGRGIAVELGAAGATVYVTGRTTDKEASPMNRSETIDETARLVTAAGGEGIAVKTDHSDSLQVERLVQKIGDERGRIDVLVNDIWGGDPLAEWGVPFWEHDLANGLKLLHGAVDTHLITSWHAARLLMKSRGGLVVEITDGAESRYRGSMFYDLAKASAIRLALAQSVELASHNVAAVALTPGFLRSESMLDHFGVTEKTWRDAVAKDPYFAYSETPHFVGRALAGLTSDPDVMELSGQALTSWDMAKRYEFSDVDGSTPDWGVQARRIGEGQ